MSNDPGARPAHPKLRIQYAQREQLELRSASLDRLVADDHPVRAVWEYACAVDLSPLYAKVRAVEGGPGRPPIDPQILFALWIYATLDGIGSGRRLALLCEEHQVYQWICGGVSVNYHTLSDFRVDCGDVLEKLLVNGIAALMKQDLVTMNAVAQDGVRVRANAGGSSFRRDEKLAAYLAAAEQQIAALKKELHDDPAASSRRQEAAQERGARERKDRVQRALAELEHIKERKKKNNEKSAARASTTDPEARTMKMADGGFRPAINIQFVTDVDSRLVLGVAATSAGSDKAQIIPMVDKLRDNYQRIPKQILVDGDFVTKENVDTLEGPRYGTTIFAPVAKPRVEGKDRHIPDPDDSPAVATWKRRMGTESAKLRYRDRASTAEWVHALARNRGLTRLLVRGLRKAKAIALWFALAHNLVQARTSFATT